MVDKRDRGCKASGWSSRTSLPSCSRLPAGRLQLSPFLLLALFLLAAGALAGCGSAPATPTSPPADPEIAIGQRLFAQNCASCHAIEPDTIIVGPSLAGLASRAAGRVEGLDARQYIQLSVLRPGEYVVEGFEDTMPSTFGKQLTGEELDALIAYLMTLQ